MRSSVGTPSTPRRRAAVVLLSTALPLLLLGGTSPAFAATSNATSSSTPQAGVTVSPATVAPGTSATVVVSGTNNSSARMNSVALGVSFSNTLKYRIISTPASTCRPTGGSGKTTFYCSLPLAAGATATIKLAVTPSTSGTYAFDAYARNIDTTAQTTATATLQAG